MVLRCTTRWPPDLVSSPAKALHIRLVRRQNHHNPCLQASRPITSTLAELQPVSSEYMKREVDVVVADLTRDILSRRQPVRLSRKDSQSARDPKHLFSARSPTAPVSSAPGGIRPSHCGRRSAQEEREMKREDDR
jgi:hypothetical protein